MDGLGCVDAAGKKIMVCGLGGSSFLPSSLTSDPPLTYALYPRPIRLNCPKDPLLLLPRRAAGGMPGRPAPQGVTLRRGNGIPLKRDRVDNEIRKKIVMRTGPVHNRGHGPNHSFTP